jgi:hypothetical protein
LKEDWALVQADVHDRVMLPTVVPTPHHADWGKDPGLESRFNPVLERIQFLAENGLTSLMVLHLSKRIAPLQARTCPTWVYIRVNDTTQLERGAGSSWNDGTLALSLMKLTPELFSTDLVAPLAACQPICMDQAARTMLLRTMPMLDDVNITAVQWDDQTHGM